MVFGVNLSFCVKRWVTPDLWAPLVREDLGLNAVQFSYDLVDPTWPDKLLTRLASDIRKQTKASGVTVHSAFIGIAHYAYNQLLHPDAEVRDVAEAWLKRAYRFAANAGTQRVGGPLGAIASRRDCREAESIPEADYQDLIARMHRLAEAAKAEGIVELYVEPTPMRREWPWTVDAGGEDGRRRGRRGGSVDVLLDWGHGTFEPLYGRYRAGMAEWFETLGQKIGVIHFQQTDFQYDRHWDFTEPGRIDPQAAAALQRANGVEAPVFLEVLYPYERDDASVLDAVKRTTSLLKPVFA